MRIGVDLMGNENSPEEIIHVLEQLTLPKGVELVLFQTSEFIAMDDPPLAALRKKKNSSLVVALRQLKAGKIDVLISAGNTGALVSGAKMILGNLPGISRPALLARLPTKKGSLFVLDVGANVKVGAKQLVQFAQLGNAYCKSMGNKKPVVGLLNIGTEAMKGTTELREAYRTLSELPSIHFAGNVEGKSVFDGDVDVLVTDGFTGNVFLKTAEGTANLLLDLVGPSNRFPAVFAGAILIGVQGRVIKCHGYSTPGGFAKTVLEAVEKKFLLEYTKPG